MYIVYSHSGHIFPREAVRGVGDQHTGLAHRPVTHHHALDRPPARHYGYDAQSDPETGCLVHGLLL